MANAVHELHLTLRPHSSGTTRFMYVNVVGILYSTDIPDEKAYLMKKISFTYKSFICSSHIWPFQIFTWNNRMTCLASTILDKSLCILSQNPANFPSTLPGTNWTAASSKDDPVVTETCWAVDGPTRRTHFLTTSGASLVRPTLPAGLPSCRPSCSTLQRGLLCDSSIFSSTYGAVTSR